MSQRKRVPAWEGGGCERRKNEKLFSTRVEVRFFRRGCSPALCSPTLAHSYTLSPSPSPSVWIWRRKNRFWKNTRIWGGGRGDRARKLMTVDVRKFSLKLFWRRASSRKFAAHFHTFPPLHSRIPEGGEAAYDFLEGAKNFIFFLELRQSGWI